ncbi:MAG: PQQ-binding-like beta-propeller repeat protein [Saprospiraceae bacterium]|nr:PQQ-binding-like beta-propeller repeat protein [Saprospiraceae bacterium]
MQKFFIFYFIFFLNQAYGQAPIWSEKVEKDAFISQLNNGNIFVKQKNAISLLDNVTGNEIWENTVTTDKDPSFFEGFPIMYFQDKSYAVLDALTGHILDKSAEKTQVLDIHYFWNEGRVIMELSRNKNLFITNIDLQDEKKCWNVKVGEIKTSMFGNVLGTSNKPSLTNDGSLILVDKKFVVTLSDKGEIKNRIDFEDKIEKKSFNAFNDYVYIVEDDKKLNAINTKTGKSAFNVKLEESDLSFQLLASGKTLAMFGGKKIFLMDASTGNIIQTKKFDDKISGSYLNPDDGKFYIASEKSIIELNTLNAEPIRQKEFSQKIGNIFEANGRLFVSGSYNANELDINNLSLKYDGKQKLPEIQDYIDFEKSTIYMSHNAAGLAINVLDPSGKTIWNENYSGVNRPIVELFKGGLLVITDTEVNFVSPKTGKSVIKSSINVDPSFVHAFRESEEILVMYSGKRMHYLDLKSGAITSSSKKIDFEDFDYEKQKPQILLMEDKTYLKGSNSIFIVDNKANIFHEAHYKKTNSTSTLLQLANIAVTAAAIGTGNVGSVLTVSQNGQQIHKGSLVDGLESSAKYARDLKEKRRRAQNKSSVRFPYVYTKLKNGKKGLIFIDPKTGKDKFDIEMTDGEPSYIVDDTDGVLFYINNSKLTAYNLK